MAPIKTNNTFSHDLAFGNSKENALMEMLQDSKLELKSDRYTNGRHAVELKKVVKGEVKPSGLSATESDWYALGKSNSVILVKVADLKEIINDIYQENYDLGKPHKDNGLLIVKGLFEMMGDGYRSYCVLLEEAELTRRLSKLRQKGVGNAI